MQVLKAHTQLLDSINEFEANYLSKMVRERDKMREGMEGVLPNQEAIEKYDLLNDKVVFLENYLIQQREIISRDAALVHYADGLLKAMDTNSISTLSKAKRKLKEVINGTNKERV